MRHSFRPQTRHHVRGLTLIELLVVISIIGILAAASWGGYQHYLTKARRAEGRAALLQTLLQQERYFSYHHTYAAFRAGPEQHEFRWHSGEQVATSAYQIEARACSDETIRSCVEVRAIPGGALVNTAYRDEACGVLTADSRGRRSADGKGECW